MRRLILVLSIAALTATGAACGDDDAEGGGGGEPVGEPAPTDPVVTIRSGGGFVPFGTDFAAVPTVILADGTVFTGGPTIAIYPGPAVNPVLTGTVPEDDVADVLEAAEEAGLTRSGVDWGEPAVTDLPTTTITVVVDGESYSHSIYALGAEGGMGDLGLTDAQLDARREVSRFLTQVQDQAMGHADAPYEPDAYQVLALPVDPSAVSTDVPPNELAWPFPDIPLEQAPAECVDVEGDDAVTLAALLPEATQITFWRDPAGATYQLTFRARLSVDEPCS